MVPFIYFPDTVLESNLGHFMSGDIIVKLIVKLVVHRADFTIHDLCCVAGKENEVCDGGVGA